MWVSITRLRLQSVRYLIPFLARTCEISRQAERSSGFIEGKLLIDRRLTFWTMTAWQNEACMRTFRASGAHAKVMPKLEHWCREAGFAGWEHAAAGLPPWSEAHGRIQMVGRKSGAAKAAGSDVIPAPRTLRVFEAKLRKIPQTGRTAAAKA